ncbi:uncharacterized protein BX663DRAFT_556042 [Cokeromyces recurvatus]|uniref:uncharacterized protein n=1 Tax=Cokeromyces recurvatus TaxID=90255 RepID=UPI0022209C0C|nr:uncharacterized protein BX663DRAFT_556042 [Cokeromyces recurvatus]KAI7898236.1 hypothetical protein BX663DRAFT_556042 [Cokeromyces recurvatus]
MARTPIYPEAETLIAAKKLAKQENGYTCRVSFCRKTSELSESASLQLDDFNQEEINKYFRPCTVDPGQHKRKQELGLTKIETDIRTLKTVSSEDYLQHVLYMMEHMSHLFEFYGFNTARYRWKKTMLALKSL